MSKILYTIVALVAVIGTASAGLFAEPNQEMVNAINKAFAAQGVSEDVAVIENGELNIVFMNKGEVDKNKALEIILASNMVVGKLPEVQNILSIDVHIINTDGSKVADGFIFPHKVNTVSGEELAQGVIDGSIIYV